MNAQRTTDILSALVVADTPAEALADLQRRWPDITAEEIEAVRRSLSPKVASAAPPARSLLLDLGQQLFHPRRIALVHLTFGWPRKNFGREC